MRRVVFTCGSCGKEREHRSPGWVILCLSSGNRNCFSLVPRETIQIASWDGDIVHHNKKHLCPDCQANFIMGQIKLLTDQTGQALRRVKTYKTTNSFQEQEDEEDFPAPPPEVNEPDGEDTDT